MTNESINAVFSFIDLIDSTRNATYLSQNEYVNDLLLPFQEIATRLSGSIINGKLSCAIRGDEVFLHSLKDEPDPSLAIRTIVEYALVLKVAIHCTNLNQERIRSQRPPLDIGVGVHVGPAVILASDGENNRIEGYSINQAKRIEAASRSGVDLKVILSNSARMGLLQRSSIDMMIVTGAPFQFEAKGISGALALFEVLEYFSPSLFDYIEALVPEFAVSWKDISENLVRISPSNCWANLLWVGYRFNRARKTEDDGLLNTILEYVQTHEFLRNKMLPLWILASVEYAKEDFVNAFFDFEKCEQISSQKRIVIPKLLSALPLVRKGFFEGGDRIDNLKREVIRARSELLPGSDELAKITELGTLLKI